MKNAIIFKYFVLVGEGLRLPGTMLDRRPEPGEKIL